MEPGFETIFEATSLSVTSRCQGDTYLFDLRCTIVAVVVGHSFADCEERGNCTLKFRIQSKMAEESIYNLIPREEVKPPKPKKYTSTFRETVKQEKAEGKFAYKTLGQAKVPVPTTDEFLKKRSGEPQLPEKKPFKYPDEDRRRAPVPARNDVPVLGMKTNKNFITTNAVNNIMSVPKVPAKKYADTRGGDTHALPPSGLEPTYVHKKNFGKTPVYLVKRQEEVRKAQEEYDAYVAEHFRRGAMKALSEGERQQIINGLKENWEELHHQYQGLSVVIDTAPKKYRKERMETEMKQLERDIEMMEKHRVVYIAN